jgi:hypothetical protein
VNRRGVYVSVKRETRETEDRSLTTIFLGILCFIGFIFLSFFIKSEYSEVREDLIERLHREGEVAGINDNLKIEYLATTRARFLELQTKRLGLKKAKEEEVLVLR